MLQYHVLWGSMIEIGIISNPKSRKNRKNPNIIKELESVIGKNGKVFKTENFDDIYKVAQEFKEKDIKILALNGGDGTIHITLSIFIKVYKNNPLPKIAILRGGTMNIISSSINSRRGTPKEILQHLIEKLNSSVPFTETQRNIMKINDEYGFIFATGIAYNFLELFYQDDDPSPLRAAKMLGTSSIKAILGQKSTLFKKNRIKIKTDGIDWISNKFTTVGTLSIREMGLGFAPGVRIKEDPNKFYLFSVKGSPLGIARSFPKLWFGYGFNKNVAQDKLTSKVILETLEGPIAFTIDGEMHTPSNKITVELGPKINFILK